MVMKEAYTPPKKISASPENGPFQKEKILPNIHFQVLLLLLSGSVYSEVLVPKKTVGSLSSGLPWLTAKHPRLPSGGQWDSMMNDDNHMDPGLQKMQSSWCFFPNPFGKICNDVKLDHETPGFFGGKQKFFELPPPPSNSLKTPIMAAITNLKILWAWEFFQWFILGLAPKDSEVCGTKWDGWKIYEPRKKPKTTFHWILVV